jgi:hypothetical protein
MVLVRTTLMEVREDARHERFEQVPGNNATNVQTAIQQAGGGARPQRSVTGAFSVLSSDSTININSPGSDLVPLIPAALSRLGIPLTFKNLPGSHAQTLTRTAPDTFDGLTTYTLNSGASVTLVPYNDGVNSGYAIE